MTHPKIIFTSVAALALLSAPLAFAKPHGERGAKMFERMDTDGDGKISAAEHDAASQERFSKMDLDGDGFVTQEEAKELRGKMKEKRDEYKNNSVE